MRILMIGPRLDVKGGISSLCNLIIDENKGDNEIIFKPSMNDRSLPGRITHFLARIVSFPYERLVIRPDLVHIHFSHSLSTWRKSLLLLIWRISGTRVVMHAHSSDYKEYFPSLPWLLRKFVLRTIGRADGLVVLSESWKEFYSSILDFNRDKIFVMETPVQKLSITENKEKIVLFSGRIGERKGAFRLLEAWSAIPSQTRSGWELILTGDGRVKKARRILEELSITDSASVKGWVEDQTLDNLMSKCSIFVLPSQNEGLPMSLLQAMSSGCAVITSPVGGIPEVVKDRDNGILVDPDDIESLSQSLTLLIEDSKLRERLSSKAVNSTRSLSIETYVPKMKKIWDSLIQE